MGDKNKKKVAILAIIALILVITAIALNLMDSEIPTTKESSEGSAQGGQVGVSIMPAPVEDKAIENTGELG